MLLNIHQEFYKLIHRKIIWFSPLILLILMVITGYAMGNDQGILLLATCYDAPDWIMLILVVIGSTIFSTEFQNNAILTLSYKSPNKTYVYLSKYITILCYNLVIHLIAILFTTILNFAPITNKLKWSTLYLYHQPL